MKKIFLVSLLLCCTIAVSARHWHKKSGTATVLPSTAKADSAAKKGPKPYNKVITDKAITRHGLFTVHKVEDKWYFEIPDSILAREMMVTTRYSKTAGGGGTYAGEMENEQTIRWEKGPENKVLLRSVTTISIADSTNEIYKAVTNSNIDPISEAFDIRLSARIPAQWSLMLPITLRAITSL